MIVAGMATHPMRYELLEQAVAAIRPQVDVLRVYLNNYDKRPPFLGADEAVLSKGALGDLGDVGKFFFFSDTDHDYYATVDDDLLYPSDYIEHLVDAFETLGRKAIVGVHGYVLKTPIDDHASRVQKHILNWELGQMTPVHVIGTNTAMMARSMIHLSLADFPETNISDIYLAGAAQRQSIPMVVIPRDKNWLREDIRHMHGSIWESTLKNQSRRVASVASSVVPQWRLLPVPPVHFDPELGHHN